MEAPNCGKLEDGRKRHKTYICVSYTRQKRVPFTLIARTTTASSEKMIFMQKKIRSALISVFYKDGLEPLVRLLYEQGIVIYSTGGTQQFIEKLGLECIPVESVTAYPSILGGRVKTLHPKIFGGILGRRAVQQDIQEMKEFEIPEIDMVVVDLYPFEETLAQTNEEKSIIEKLILVAPR